MKQLIIISLIAVLLISIVIAFNNDMQINNGALTIKGTGDLYAKSITIDSVHLNILPARVSAYITDSGQTTTTDAGTYYFMQGTFQNKNTQKFGFIGDTLQYQNGNYKYLVGAYSFTIGSDMNTTEIVTSIFRNDELIEGSNGYFISRMQIPIGKVTGCFMFRVMNNDKIKIMVKSNKAGAIITVYNGSTWLHEIY